MSIQAFHPRRQACHILDRLDAAHAQGCHLILITAPAGSCKTALLRQWTSERLSIGGIRFIWIDLQPADNDLHRFWQDWVTASRTLIRTFDAPITAFTADALAFAWPDPMVDAINALAEVRGNFAMILDNYQVIHQLAVHQTIGLLLDYPPAGMQLVIASQTEPPLQLARLRARRQLLEIGPAELDAWCSHRYGSERNDRRSIP